MRRASVSDCPAGRVMTIPRPRRSLARDAATLTSRMRMRMARSCLRTAGVLQLAENVGGAARREHPGEVDAEALRLHGFAFELFAHDTRTIGHSDVASQSHALPAHFGVRRERN